MEAVRERKGNPFKRFVRFLRRSNGKVRCSMAIMGLGQLLYKQWVKGCVYLACLAGMICFLVFGGAEAMAGFFTLGTRTANPLIGKAGDNSVVMLVRGILAWLAVIFTAAVYISNVKDAAATQRAVESGGRPKTFRQTIRSLLDEKFYVSTLLLPVIGVAVFNILPIIFMIFVAFTNYGGDIVPPKLVDWTGFQSFIQLFTLTTMAPTFGKIFVWNICWAVVATFVNYFGGLGLALLLNKKCVKGKLIWRAFPILAYAVPGFITLLGFKFMFSGAGPINQLIVSNGGSEIMFLDKDAKWMARGIGLFVNAWISIPASMLLATGILSNMNTDLYEAAEIDGASRRIQFIKITLPFVIFATTPVLISQFIGNFNNFGVFYFLRGDAITDGYFMASDTDLLINWLYRLTVESGSKHYYNIGAAVSIIIFIFTSAISLIVYVLSPSYKREDTYR